MVEPPKKSVNLLMWNRVAMWKQRLEEFCLWHILALELKLFLNTSRVLSCKVSCTNKKADRHLLWLFFFPSNNWQVTVQSISSCNAKPNKLLPGIVGFFSTARISWSFPGKGIRMFSAMSKCLVWPENLVQILSVNVTEAALKKSLWTRKPDLVFLIDIVIHPSIF